MPTGSPGSILAPGGPSWSCDSESTVTRVRRSMARTTIHETSSMAHPYCSSAWCSSAVANARIEVPVEHVDREIDRYEHHRDEQDRRLRERIVALIDRPQHEAADAGEREDLLDHDRSAEQDSDLQSGHGHDRDQRVLERVLEDDEAIGEALGRRRADVLGP